MKVISEKVNMFSLLDQQAERAGSILKAEIDVTNRCPCKCFFCFQGAQHISVDELSFGKIEELLIELRKMGCLYLSFTGGEPFCRMDFVEILELACSMGFIVTFISNMQLASREQLSKISTFGVTNTSVSFHSIDPTKYALIFGVDRKAYFHALENIEYMISQKMKVGIAVTVSQYNVTELNDIVLFFEKIGIPRSRVTFNTLLEGKTPISKWRQPAMLDVLGAYPMLKENLFGKMRMDNYSHLCSAGRIACVIKANGDILACGMLPIVAGNIYHHSLKDIWEGAEIFRKIRSIREADFLQCFQCKYIDSCPLCIATNYNETGSFTTPSQSYCTFRKKMAAIMLEESENNE